MERDMLNNSNIKACIVGMGYVGLPLFLESIKYFSTIGYDQDTTKINNLRKTYRKYSKYFLNNINYIKECNLFIICVPTPIDKNNLPNLSNLKNACKRVASVMRPGSIVIFESTVFPGCTEEICLPILSKTSNLKYKRDFFIGYSPERINPGDTERNITNIVKVVSACNAYSLKVIDNYYKKIVKVGTHKTNTIRTAEAAKVIENTQRDLNIAFVNELSIMFKKFRIETKEVLKAASTKWNFLNFQPGLVGGHCIGVDPYYLTYKSKKMGFNPNFILSGRKINENMYKIVCSEIIALTKKKKISLNSSKLLVLGVTFKDNCDDFRNSQIIKIINYFKNKKLNIEVYDPIVDKKLIKQKKIKILDKLNFKKKYDIVILARNHKVFNKLKYKHFTKLKKSNSVFYDINNYFRKNLTDGSL